MNYLSPKNVNESKGALAEGALKKVSLCLNLKTQKSDMRHAPSKRSRYCVAGKEMITAAQLRAARGLLDWTRADLAKAASISPETVKNIEHGTFHPQEGTADAIVKAFAAHDVEFTDDEGVRIKRDNVTRYEGPDEFKKFMDDVYDAAQQPYSLNGTKPICVCNVDNNLFKKHLKEYATHHINRMIKIENLKIRALAVKEDETHVSGADYIQYKYFAEAKSLHVPFYVYGDKFAIINFEVENSPRIIVINSSLVAQSYRDQFSVMWETASNEPKELRGVR